MIFGGERWDDTGGLACYQVRLKALTTKDTKLHEGKSAWVRGFIAAYAFRAGMKSRDRIG
jgi:hypothetical protein